jgi:hypothetical protein
LLAGIAALALSGCDRTGAGNGMNSADVPSAATADSAGPLRLKPVFPTGSVHQLSAESDIDTVIATGTLEVRLPPSAAAGVGRIYVVKSREGNVRLSPARGDGMDLIEGFNLRQGQTVMVMADGERAWIVLQAPSS